MKQTISGEEHLQVRRYLDLISAIGRRNSLRDPLAKLVEQAGLTSAQMHALSWLRQEGPLTMGELAQRLGVTEKTITGVVDRLERANYAARERDASDRRVVRVVLSAPGRKLANQLNAEIERKLGQFLAFLDAQDRAALLRILENIAAKLAAHDSTADSTND